jgi:uncharacterized protein YyaL (SSP411 family)
VSSLGCHLERSEGSQLFDLRRLKLRATLTDHPPNRLKDSASPYLRSAAHQPIDWYEWGDAAFSRAKSEDKPILLDIGAVWCHWCHVIDRESYENVEIAKIINEHFIPVKVDRDERPDVDSRYQSAISAISGQGGWPLTGFLLPDGKPFFGGTYFPPDDQMGRPGFRRVLLAVADSYRNKRAELERAAYSLAGAVAQAEIFTGARADFDPGVIETQIRSITEQFDIKNGGFGRSPKFAHASAIDLLLERYQQTVGRSAAAPEKEKHLLAIVETTLEKMAFGGVYDQLAGGFHRYSVDERWLVPHFEKMSYDNSELLRNYLHAYQVTRNDFLRETSEGIIRWVNEVLSDQERGGFYASQDADYSLDDDGDYFTWTLDEVRTVLTPEESRVIELYYDVEPHGEMHHNPAKNVLWIARNPFDIAKQLGLDEATVRLTIAKTKGKMLAARLLRPTPYIDKTMYVSWNAMFLSAYLDAARVLGDSLGGNCRAFALKTLDRMMTEVWSESRGFAHRIGGPALDGSLDDQVFSRAALFPRRTDNDGPRHRTIRRRRRRRLLRSSLRRPSDGRPRRSPQTLSGFANAWCQLRRCDRSNPSPRLHGRRPLPCVRTKNAGSLRGHCPAVRTLRRHLRPRCHTLRASPAASRHHRPRR